MSLSIDWPEIALRLLCSVLAGVLIGLNRTRHGRAAGLRTMTLVSVAACVSMIQVNLLLGLAGKAPNSFVTLDLMRLPLGILSGMGFIGAGAILRRDNLVVGVTTAAAMWFVTVLGLCFGGGQITLGLVALGIGLIILAGMKFAENRMDRERLVTLDLTLDASGPAENDISQMLTAAGMRINSLGVTRTPSNRELHFDLLWRLPAEQADVPEVIDAIARQPGMLRVAWSPITK
jgi:putative Mg2+ transporter-C (MgtC) family protein